MWRAKETYVDGRSPRVQAIRVLHSRTVELRFEDGVRRTMDLSPLLRGPIFAEIAASDEAFGAVTVDPDFGTIAWPNGADLDPTVLRGMAAPSSPVSGADSSGQRAGRAGEAGGSIRPPAMEQGGPTPPR